MAKRRNPRERKRRGIDRRPAPWEPYDPRWLARLAREQFPEDWELQEALERCTMARQNNCCAPTICGYQFVDGSNPNQPGSAWQHEQSLMLQREDGAWIVVDILQDGRVGGIEFV